MPEKDKQNIMSFERYALSKKACEVCEMLSEEYIHHLFMQCSGVQDMREEILGNIYENTK